jgi:GNAT superfamily N-acetyltransferase
VIRRATAADAAGVAALLRALNEEPGLAPERITADGVRRDLVEDPRAIVLVAAEGDAILGLATAHPAYDSGQSRWGLFLNDLYVAPAARRRGIARALVAAVAAASRSAGGSYIWWNADAGDDLAFRFHRSLGAVEAEVTDFLLEGAAFDRLAMEAIP